MLLSQVEAMREQLRPSERKLADYVLEAPREVLDLAMTDFAARVGVSQPTIARFCRALGFSGFREFKIRLAQSVAGDVPTVYRDVRTDEPAAGVAAKVLDRTIGALIQVRNSLSTDSVAAAIALLADARRIEFYGAGDVVVAISNTGRTKDILDACKSALDGGARVIAITHGNSPLARMASVGLFANVDEDTDIFSPMTSRVSHLAIGDILAVGVALARGPQLAEKLAQAKDVLEKRRVGA